MRITTSMRHAMIDRALRRSSQDVYTTAAQASTGLRVTRPGDDPAAYASITNKDGQIAKLESRIAALPLFTRCAVDERSEMAQFTVYGHSGQDRKKRSFNGFFGRLRQSGRHRCRRR